MIETQSFFAVVLFGSSPTPFSSQLRQATMAPTLPSLLVFLLLFMWYMLARGGRASGEADPDQIIIWRKKTWYLPFICSVDEAIRTETIIIARVNET
jgi:hypothetical protein